MRHYHLPTLVKNVMALPPEASANNADDQSDAIDLEAVGQFHSGQVVCSLGAPTGGPTAYSVDYKIQESPNGTAWTDVDGAALTHDADKPMGIIEFAPNELDLQMRIDRQVSTTGGSSAKVPNQALVQLAHGRNIPG